MSSKIRPVSAGDIDAVLAIEKKSFTLPFTRELFMKMIIAQPPFGGMAAETDGLLAGYLFYSIAADEMELLTVAVDGEHRRMGIAKRLICEMIGLAKTSGIRNIFLEVRPSNTAARRLYAGFGFEEFGIRKGYYKDNNEDAIVMKRSFL